MRSRISLSGVSDGKRWSRESIPASCDALCLRADVDVRRGVVADEDRREADRLAERAHVLGDLRANLQRERLPVDPDRRHRRRRTLRHRRRHECASTLESTATARRRCRSSLARSARESAPQKLEAALLRGLALDLASPEALATCVFAAMLETCAVAAAPTWVVAATSRCVRRGGADRLRNCGLAGRNENRCARHGDRDRTLQAVRLDVRVVEQALDAVAVERERDLVAAEVGGSPRCPCATDRWTACSRPRRPRPDLEPELGLLVLLRAPPRARCARRSSSATRRSSPACRTWPCVTSCMDPPSVVAYKTARPVPHLPSGASRESARRRR